jgi:hypothetical protein
MTTEEMQAQIESMMPTNKEIFERLEAEDKILRENFIKTTQEAALNEVAEQLKVIGEYVDPEHIVDVSVALSKCFTHGVNFGKEYLSRFQKMILGY